MRERGATDSSVLGGASLGLFSGCQKACNHSTSGPHGERHGLLKVGQALVTLGGKEIALDHQKGEDQRPDGPEKAQRPFRDRANATRQQAEDTESEKPVGEFFTLPRHVLQHKIVLTRELGYQTDAEQSEARAKRKDQGVRA